MMRDGIIKDNETRPPIPSRESLLSSSRDPSPSRETPVLPERPRFFPRAKKGGYLASHGEKVKFKGRITKPYSARNGVFYSLVNLVKAKNSLQKDQETRLCLTRRKKRVEKVFTKNPGKSASDGLAGLGIPSRID
jgi:hypothetical protein